MSTNKKHNHNNSKTCLVFKRVEGMKPDIIVGDYVFKDNVDAVNWLMNRFPDECKTIEDVNRLYAIRRGTKRAIVRAVRNGIENNTLDCDKKSLLLSVFDIFISYLENDGRNCY